MGIARGPNQVNEDLIYGYDTGYGIADPGLSTRFFKGKPTVNLQVNGVAFGHNSGNYGNVVTVADAPTKGDGWKKVTISNRGNNFRILQWTYTGHDSNVIYNHSAEFDWGNMRDKGYSIVFDGSGGGTRNYYRNRDYSTSGSTSINAGLENGHFASNITKSGTHAHSWFIYHYTTGVSGLNDYFYYKDYQVERQTVSSPFVSGTRSSTESLIDLKRTTNINAGSMSFNSDGQPEFDGTDDIINTGLFSGRNPKNHPFTIEAIVKSDITSGARIWLDATGNGSNQRLYCAHAATGTSTPLGIQGSAWSSGGAITDTDYHHYVITMNGSTAQLYNNNVAHSSKSYTSYTLSGQINVGGRSGYRWVGKIPVFKIYDKVLNTTEIEKNYKTYKNRFNL